MLSSPSTSSSSSPPPPDHLLAHRPHRNGRNKQPRPWRFISRSCVREMKNLDTARERVRIRSRCERVPPHALTRCFSSVRGARVVFLPPPSQGRWSGHVVRVAPRGGAATYCWFLVEGAHPPDRRASEEPHPLSHVRRFRRGRPVRPRPRRLATRAVGPGLPAVRSPSHRRRGVCLGARRVGRHPRGARDAHDASRFLLGPDLAGEPRRAVAAPTFGAATAPRAMSALAAASARRRRSAAALGGRRSGGDGLAAGGAPLGLRRRWPLVDALRLRRRHACCPLSQASMS